MAKFEMKLDMSSIKKKIKTTEEQIKQGIEQGLKVCASEIKQMEQRQIENTTGSGQYVPTGRLKRGTTILPLEWSPYGASITITNIVPYAT